MSEASRVEELMKNAEPERFDVHAVLESTTAAYRDVYAARKFDFASGVEDAHMTGSPELLIQMLDKLVDNAVDFSADGHTIGIGLERSDAQLMLTVTNPGPPLPERMRSQLFDSMVSQLLRSDLPAALLRHFDRIEDRGEVQLEGETRRLLVLEFSPSITVRYWLDPETLLVLRAEGAISSEAMSIDFQTRYADFRPVEGVLVPHHEENWAGGRHVATTTIEKVVVEHQPAAFFRR